MTFMLMRTAALLAAVTMPLAVKLGPYFSAMANMAKRLEGAGANSLVLFNPNDAEASGTVQVFPEGGPPVAVGFALDPTSAPKAVTMLCELEPLVE